MRNFDQRRWSGAHKLYLIEARATGATWVEIGEHLGRSYSACFEMHAKIMRAAQAAKQPGMTKRHCLCCRLEFPSEGAHNRMCQRCRDNSRHITPLEPCAVPWLVIR